MGWGIAIKDVYLSRVRKGELDYEIERSKDYVSILSKNLLAIAASSPKEVNEIPWHEYVSNEVDTILDEYADEIFKLRLMEIAKGDLKNIKEY